jgi:hypothetical protein
LVKVSGKMLAARGESKNGPAGCAFQAIVIADSRRS